MQEGDIFRINETKLLEKGSNMLVGTIVDEVNCQGVWLKYRGKHVFVFHDKLRD